MNDILYTSNFKRVVTRLRFRSPIFAFVVALVLAASGSRFASGQMSAERQLLELANHSRAEHGLGPLAWDKSLAVAAQQHVQWVSRSPQLSHQYPGESDLAARGASAGARFQEIAENIAEGQSAASLHDQWMHSPPHRANILDPKIDSMGVAIASRGGILFAVEDFSHAVEKLGPQQVEGKVATLMAARGIAATGSRDIARATCAMEHGSAGGTRPMFVMRWEGADLGRLPDVLEERIRTGKYHRAAVGACPGGQQAFSSYRVAVLLYY